MNKDPKKKIYFIASWRADLLGGDEVADLLEVLLALFCLQHTLGRAAHEPHRHQVHVQCRLQGDKVGVSQFSCHGN